MPAASRAHLVDGLQARGEVFAVVEIEQHDGPLGRDEAVARGVVHGPDGHVARTQCVADVDRVEQHGRTQVAPLELFLDAPEAVGAQPRHVDLRLGVGEVRGRGMANEMV